MALNDSCHWWKHHFTQKIWGAWAKTGGLEPLSWRRHCRKRKPLVSKQYQCKFGSKFEVSDTKTRIDIKNLLRTKFRYCYVASESVVICQLTLKLPEEIDLKIEEFLTLKVSWPWPWIGSYGIPSCITYRPLPTYKFHWNRKNFLWTDGRTDVRTTSDPYY